jgi:hypothetical protein
MNKPWEQYGMTESEWHQYQDEYADWIRETETAE